MPVPAGPATFEDLIAYLDGKPSPFDMVRRMALISEGLHNLQQRLHDVEACRLEDLHRMEALESLTKEERTVLTSLEQDRTALQKEVAALAARIDALEKAKVVAEKPLVVDIAAKPPFPNLNPAPVPSA